MRDRRNGAPFFNLFSVLCFFLVISFFGLAYISPRLGPGVPLEQMPILLFTAVMVFSGVIYFLIIYQAPKINEQKNLFVTVLVVGVVLRLLMMFSAPIITVDYFRYLWDGAVTASSVNPYIFSPNQALSTGITTQIPDVVAALSIQEGSTLPFIIFPELRTPYPPIAQLFFAMTYFLKPWSLNAWRLILIVFDLLTLGILVRLLSDLDRPTWWVAIYWLNPVLIKETINSGHFDLLVIPFILGGLYLVDRKKYPLSLFFLLIAVGVKVWPIVLLPVFVRPLFPDIKRVVSSLVLFITLCTILFYPVYVSGIDDSMGLLAYATRWEYNDSLFKVVLTLSSTLISTLKITTVSAQHISRIGVAIIFFSWVVHIVKDKPETLLGILRQSTLIIAGLLMLSPTQFPWYYAWLVPFLAFIPLKPMLLLSFLFPLYYLRFHFFAIGQVSLYDNNLVLLQFIPVGALILYEWKIIRSRSEQI